MGDAGYNMANSLMVGCAKMGMHFVACAPEAYFPNKELIETCQEIAKQTGAILEFITDPIIATKGADVIYTDVWVSMGDEAEAEKRRADFKEYQVNQELIDLADDDVIFMHCLPAIRGEEVSAEVIDGPHSVVYDQAENRMHAQKGVLYYFLKELQNQ